MDKKCTSIHGLFTDKEIQFPPFDKDTFVTHNLPMCPNCSNVLRPNVSMFGILIFMKNHMNI